jgi:hypothetical protein
MNYRYQDTQITKNVEMGNRFYVNSIYPDIPFSDTDAYVIPVLGDRLDLFAYDIYDDSSLWWIIASANGLPGDSLIPPIGQQLRIPTDIQPIIDKYNSVNKIR